jgi:hypothetical protein
LGRFAAFANRKEVAAIWVVKTREGRKGFPLISLTCFPVPKPTWAGFFSSARQFKVTIAPLLFR